MQRSLFFVSVSDRLVTLRRCVKDSLRSFCLTFFIAMKALSQPQAWRRGAVYGRIGNRSDLREASLAFAQAPNHYRHWVTVHIENHSLSSHAFPPRLPLYLTDHLPPMSPTKACLRWAGSPPLRDAFPCQKSPRHHYSRSIRPYSTSNASAKPRPYTGPPKPKPLVRTGTQTSNSIPSSSPNATHPPNANPKSRGIYAPYWRISLGVVLCGSLVYSMVASLPPHSIPKLTCLHASSPPPSSSKAPPSPTETPS